MNIEDVAAEIGDKADTITGLRVFRYVPDKVPTRAFVVGLPDDVTYDETFGRGSDALTFPAWVLLDKIHDRSSYVEMVRYLNGSGPSSIKAAVDSKRLTNEYTSCDTVRVRSAETGFFDWGAATMIGAQFSIIVTGSGS